MTILSPVLALLLPILLGALAGATKRFRDPEGAVDALNAFALTFAFPALIFRGVMTAPGALPTQPGFWLVIPLALLASLALARLFFPTVAGTLALILGFGNVAYLGLPVVSAVLEDATAIAALAVAVHVAFGLLLGPVLLLRWSGGEGAGSSLRRVAKQPLLWSPLLGVLARQLPRNWRSPLGDVLAPLGAAAAPVALFLLGLYLYLHRSRVRRVDALDLAHVGMKLLLLPSVTAAFCLLFLELAWLAPLQAQVLVLLACMPAAITTFSLARDLGVGTERTGRAIVTTTLASALTLAAAAWLVRLL